MNQHNGNHKPHVETVSAPAKSEKSEKGVARANEDVSRWENEGGSPALAGEVKKGEGSQLQQWVERFLHDAPATLDEVRVRVEKEVRARPLMAIGIASAVGFVVGGGFRSKSGRKMIKRAIQYGMAQAQNVKDGGLE